ncbi:MAG: hypothetical protein AB1491_00050 [Thermodesulfobacteriota bacterium]
MTMEDLELKNLRERTAGRNEAIWHTFDLEGLTLPGYEALVNATHGGAIHQFIASVDAEIEADEARRNLLHEADLAEVSQDRRLAYERVRAQRQALAIKNAAELYLLAAREYDAKVKALIMAAREYAAEVEKEQIELERFRAELAHDKEVVRGEEIHAKIFFELVEQKQLEAERAKTQIEVTRATIRALMAEVEAEQAELKVILEELEVAMTEAEKATLNADIALIIADITTRGLAGIRLGVEKAEIAEAYQYIQQHLTDVLHLLELKTLGQEILRDSETVLQGEIWNYLTSQKAQEKLKLLNAQSDARVAQQDVSKTLAFAQQEGQLRQGVGMARALLATARSNAAIMALEAKADADVEAYAAQEQVYQSAEYTNNYTETLYQHYYKG